MENARYGVTDPRSDDPVAEMSRAIAELARVSAGPMLLSVPYGRREDHGWFRQLDGADVETLLDAAGRRASVTVFRYSADGWEVSDLKIAADAAYRTSRPTQRQSRTSRPQRELSCASRSDPRN